MARVGILACQVLETELAILIQEHPEIESISLIRSPEARAFSELLDRPVHYINDYCFLRKLTSKKELLIHILPAGLHADVDLLEDECTAAIASMKNYVVTTLLFYGLCGNALSKIFAREDISIVPVHDDGVVDDCIVASLGREAYMGELRNTGSLFLTDGWVAHWDKVANGIGGVSSIKAMLDMDGYSRVRYITQEKGGLNEQGARDLAKSLDLEFSSCAGTMELLRRSFEDALARM